MIARDDIPIITPVLYHPRSLQEAWELKRELGPDAVYVAGSTLLRTQWDAGTATLPKALIDLRGVEGMSGIHADGGEIRIGAMTDMSVCRSSAELEAAAPSLREAARVIAAPSVRNLATLGGNIASGYGDVLPALLAIDAVLDVYDGEAGEVSLPVRDWLAVRWSGEGAPQAIVAGVRIPKAEAGAGERRYEAYRKVGRREAFTPSLVTAALSGTVGADGLLRGVRIAAGGGSGRPHRLGRAEALLEGGRFREELLPLVYEAVLEEYEAAGDAFATAAYKRKTAANLIAAELWRLLERMPEPGSGPQTADSRV
ncbi:FAD binding domain-containing protein [Paenibacillus macerans]|uniref:FAD binding domain-containing protein n=1 Tax=Paenibacillus macerans TaxID=44252 RepID=UPI003D317504